MASWWIGIRRLAQHTAIYMRYCSAGHGGTATITITIKGNEDPVRMRILEEVANALWRHQGGVCPVMADDLQHASCYFIWGTAGNYWPTGAFHICRLTFYCYRCLFCGPCYRKQVDHKRGFIVCCQCTIRCELSYTSVKFFPLQLMVSLRVNRSRQACTD